MCKTECIKAFLEEYMTEGREYATGELYSKYLSHPGSLFVSNKDFASYLRLQAENSRGILRHVSHGFYALRAPVSEIPIEMLRLKLRARKSLPNNLRVYYETCLDNLECVLRAYE